jgi:hypothetical protein
VGRRVWNIDPDTQLAASPEDPVPGRLGRGEFQLIPGRDTLDQPWRSQ